MLSFPFPDWPEASHADILLPSQTFCLAPSNIGLPAAAAMLQPRPGVVNMAQANPGEAAAGKQGCGPVGQVIPLDTQADGMDGIRAGMVRCLCLSCYSEGLQPQ